MRYGIISDIHANLAALNSVLEELENRNIDELVCLGDIVGYCAEPQECLQLCREKATYVIAGNHDRYTSGDDYSDLKETIQAAITYTREKLSDEEIQHLSRLTDSLKVKDIFLMVHGSIKDRDEYILTTSSAQANLYALRESFAGMRIAFFGHTHMPMVISRDFLEVDFHETQTITLRDDAYYLINPGSVGQPRDRCPLASCGVYDTESQEMTIIRKSYDIEQTQKKIASAGLDEFLAHRLELGI